MTPEGIEWTSPTGHLHPPEQQDSQPPVYNDWLKELIDATLKAVDQGQGLYDAPDVDQDEDSDPEAHPDWVDEDDMDPQDPRWESYFWGTNNLPEPPAQSPEDQEIVQRMSIEDYLRRHPRARQGGAAAA